MNIPLLQEMTRTCAGMYRLGWDERNGGNLSVLLDETPAQAKNPVLRVFPTGFAAPALSGRCLLITAAGSYFKNIPENPERDLGLVRIGPGGRSAELLWGFSDGGQPTSELAAHLMSHCARLCADPENRVVLHCHPTHLLAMTFVHELSEAAFTRSLWRMITECIMVFPEGVGVLPWMMCGTNVIGEATAQKMRDFRLVVWAQHGVYGAGRSLDEAFGLVETAEKAAQIYMLTAHLPRVNDITDVNLRQIVKTLKLPYRKVFLP